ncbi:MAG: glycosyltransferase [Anaerolineae bacterium]
MRILHITPYYYPAWGYGGPVRVVYEIATRQAARGHSVTVLTTDALDAHSRAPAGRHLIDGVEVVRCPNLNNALAWRRLFAPIGFGRHLRRLAPAFDVAHLHEARSLLNALALPVLLRHYIPYIVSPQGGLPIELGRTAYKRVFDAVVGKRLLTHAARLHALTPIERDQYTPFGVSPDQIVMIPNGIDPAAFDNPADIAGFKQAHDIPADAPVVGFVGRLNVIKGVDFLVDAFASIRDRHPDAVLMLVGPDDGLRPALEAQIARLGIGEAVRFVGYVGGSAEKAAAYRTADVYILPSRYEIFGITVLEALLNGVPTIVTERCGLAEELLGEGLVRVVPFGNITALGAEIAAVLEPPPAQPGRAEYGQQYIAAHFGWDILTERWLDAYQQCLSA